MCTSLKLYCQIRGSLYIILCCLKKGFISLQHVNPAVKVQCLFWCWNLQGETSFSLRITFHQPTNASCFKEKTYIPQLLHICHQVLRDLYSEYLSKFLRYFDIRIELILKTTKSTNLIVQTNVSIVTGEQMTCRKTVFLTFSCPWLCQHIKWCVLQKGGQLGIICCL